MTEITVQINDVSQMADIRRAIKMLRGVGGVSLPRRNNRKTELQKAIDEERNGKLYEASDVDDLIRQLNA